MNTHYIYQRAKTEPLDLPSETDSSRGCVSTVVVAVGFTILIAFLGLTRSYENVVATTLESKSPSSVATLRQLQQIPSPILNQELSRLAIQFAELEHDDSREQDLVAALEGNTSRFEAQLASLRKQFEQAVDGSCRLVSHNPNQVRSILTWALSIEGASKETAQRWESQRQSLPVSNVDPSKVQLVVRERNENLNEVICEVLDANKVAVQGLTAVDFAVLDHDDRPWTHFAVTEQNGTNEVSSFVMLLDSSSSMSGAKLEQLKVGTSKFLNALNKQTSARVVGFASSVQPLTAFTTTAATLQSAIQSLKADGGTETAQGIEFCVNDLAKREGKKFILLCTDGDDPTLRNRLQSIVQRCNQNAVQISVLAIRDQSVNVPLLTELATKTGGNFLEAKDPAAISQKLEEIAAKQATPYYRIAIFPPGAPLSKLQVKLFNQRKAAQLTSSPR